MVLVLPKFDLIKNICSLSINFRTSLSLDNLQTMVFIYLNYM